MLFYSQLSWATAHIVFFLSVLPYVTIQKVLQWLAGALCMFILHPRKVFNHTKHPSKHPIHPSFQIFFQITENTMVYWCNTIYVNETYQQVYLQRCWTRPYFHLCYLVHCHKNMGHSLIGLHEKHKNGPSYLRKKEKEVISHSRHCINLHKCV